MVIYCTTNLITFEKYIGYDTHNNPNYFGSGIRFKLALKKYGKENFKKQILEYCDNFENLLEAEIYWIDYFGAQKSDLFYNIAPGGGGGDINNHPNKKEIIERINETRKQTLLKYPEIILKAKEKRRHSVAKNPTPTILGIEKRRETLIKNPEIMKAIIEKVRALYISHPEIRENSKQKLKETLLKNPLIIQESIKKRKQTLKNNPEIDKERSRKRQETFDKSPEIMKRQVEKLKKTLSKKPTLTCTHCGHQSKNKGNMTQNHFDRCKLNPNFDFETEIKKKEERRKKLLNRPLIICCYCDYKSYNKGSMSSWHNDNCKHNPLKIAA